MELEELRRQIASWPKAELHLHLEGSVEPATLVELALRHGIELSAQEAQSHYQYTDFRGFLDAFKWATSFLRQPADYALVTVRLGEALLRQNVIYAEVIVSAGVMAWRNQDVEANFAAIAQAGQGFRARGLQLLWSFDAVRQFGVEAAMHVARLAAGLKNEGVVSFGIGGDELALPAHPLRGIYDFAASQGLHRVIHAGETGPPEAVRDAIEILGCERIGHGIAAAHDPAVMDLLIERGVVLEVCPTSNLCTGALAGQLGRDAARIEDHPVRALVERGVRVTLSTDDPAMFRTDLVNEYVQAARAGLSLDQLRRLAAESFAAVFSCR